MTEVKAWHFIRENLKLGYGDNRVVSPGKTYQQPDMNREPHLCVYGMHGTKNPLRALQSSPGTIVCRVMISGRVKEDCTSFVGDTRRVIWMADAKEALQLFARQCAQDMIHLWDAPQVVKDWLETGNEDLNLPTWHATQTLNTENGFRDAVTATNLATLAQRDKSQSDTYAYLAASLAHRATGVLTPRKKQIMRLEKLLIKSPRI